MTLLAFPLIPFLAFLVAGTVLAVAGAVLLLRGRRSRTGVRSRRRIPEGAVALVVGLLVLGGAISSWIAWEANEADYLSQFTFTYAAEVEFNGSGVVRVSLPIPTEERLLAGLVVAPSSSSSAYNRSSAEPALDVTLAAPTTVSAEFRGRSPPDRFEPANLTRNDVRVPCYAPSCVSELSLEVLSGNVSAVHVHLRAWWGMACSGRGWEQAVWILPGTADYSGEWLAVAC